MFPLKKNYKIRMCSFQMSCTLHGGRSKTHHLWSQHVKRDVRGWGDMDFYVFGVVPIYLAKPKVLFFTSNAKRDGD